jgi:hypothetical protein
MNRHIVALLAVASVAATAVAHGQTQPARVSDEQLATIDASIRVQVRAIADSALARGLPAEPILNSARSARLRGGLTGDAVVAGLSRRLALMGEARTALGMDASHQDINAGADALKNGATAQSLARLSSEKRVAARYVALGVLAELVASSVPVDVAERAVLTLVTAGARDTDLTEFRKVVQSDIALGGVPAASATERVKAAVTVDGSGATVLKNGPAIRAPGAVRIPIPPEEN